jgi:hypothetical protein
MSSQLREPTTPPLPDISLQLLLSIVCTLTGQQLLHALGKLARSVPNFGTSLPKASSVMFSRAKSKL